jgi:hypothetical protein
LVIFTSFEARRIALVAETNRLQVSKLDERSLIIAAMAAKYMAAVPAMMLLRTGFRLVPEDLRILSSTSLAIFRS